MENLKYIWILVLWVFFWVIIWILFSKISRYKSIKEDRKASIKKSKSVILWEVYEKIMPFLPNFPYKPKDMVFVGKWIDYIIFDWLNEWDLKKIVFLEVKSWTSGLNKNEKMIRDIISKKEVEYIEYRV